MKKYILLPVIILMLVLLVGCKKKASEPKSDLLEDISQEEETTDMHVGQVQSTLTGQWIAQEKAQKRPFAIMFNNIKYASPQSGTSEAAILYEAIVEGGITRLMGIFEDPQAERIGSIRSARHYFASFADEYDAIFVHYGHTKYALSKIAQLQINNLSGLSGIGTTVFYRDRSIRAPHNAFTSRKGLDAGVKALRYRTVYRNATALEHVQFYEHDTDLAEAMSAKKLTVAYSNYTAPYFIYEPEEKQYTRYQFGQAHIDKNTGKPLQFKNIIVQFVKEWNIDKNGYQTMDLENASGSGYYLTNGKAVEITWRKNESTKQMHYYDKNGTILKINPGKTFISIFPKDRSSHVTFEEENK